jgi:purine-binding chemotaxis protein CheW
LLANVSEIMRPLPLERVARAPAVVMGLSLIRGEPTVVLDLGGLLGASQNADAQRYVALRVEQRSVALAVEEVLGIGPLPATLHELPPLLSSAQAELVSELGALDSALMLVLKAARVITDASALASGELA